MKWLKLSLLLLAGPVLAEQANIGDFSGGINSQYDSLTIADNEVQDALNVLFDENNAVVSPEGFSTYATSGTLSYVGSWSYTDGSSNNWIVVQSSDAIRASKTDGNFSVRVATVPAGLKVNATVAFNFIWFTDQTQGVYYWNGTSTTYVASSPRGSFIDQYRNRIAVSGLASPNQAQLYLSKYLDGATWTTGSLVTDAVVLTFGLQDNSDIVTGMFGGYNDVLLVFKKNSTWGLYGFDQDDFQVRVLNKEVGTIDQRSVQPFQGGVVFASPRAIEYFDGVNATPISDKIKNRVDPILNTAFNYRTWLQTTQTDWQSGAGAPTGNFSTTLSAGDVVLSSYTATDTVTADFAQGTLTNTTTYAGVSVRLSTSVGNLPNYDMNDTVIADVLSDWEDGHFTRYNGDGSLVGSACGATWTGFVGTYFAYSTQGQTASQSPKIVTTIYELVSGTTIYTDTVNMSGTADCSFSTNTISVSASDVGKRVQLVFTSSDTHPSSDIDVLRTTNSFVLSGDISYMYAWDTIGGNPHAVLDYVTGGSNTIHSGEFQSRTFDTGTSSAVVYTSALWTVDTSTPSFELQTTSNSTTGPWFVITRSTGTNTQTYRYLRYLSSFTVTANGNSRSTLDEVAFVAKSTGGTFITQINNAPNFSAWDIFSANAESNGGTITYYTRAGTSTFIMTSATPTWVAQTNNAIVSASTGTYFQARADFSISFATHNPTLNDLSLNWYEGSAPPLMASVVFEDRYYLATTTSTTGTANDALFVLGRNFRTKGPIWSIWDVQAGTLLSHQGRMYHGNNQANGKFYRDFESNTRDGATFISYIKTKDYTLGDITKDKAFDSFYAVTDAGSAQTVATSYYLNKVSTAYALDTVTFNEEDGLNVRKLMFPLDSNHPNFGKTISFKWSSSEALPWKIFGGVLNYRPYMTQ